MDTYNFPDIYRGDTFSGITFNVTVNAVPMDLTNTEIYWKVNRGSKDGSVALRKQTGNGITITDAVNGQFKIDPIAIAMDAGLYYYDITFKTGSVVKTYITGEINVLQNVE